MSKRADDAYAEAYNGMWADAIDPWIRTWLNAAKARVEAKKTFYPCRTKEELEGAHAEAEGYARRASAVIRAAEARVEAECARRTSDVKKGTE